MTAPQASANRAISDRLSEPQHDRSKIVTGLEDLVPLIEVALSKSIARSSVTGGGCPERLADAMRYALLAPGKRLRPGLVLMAGEVCGVVPHSEAAQQLMPAAAAVEMIHAYSLIHDDLPAMDDDDLRRGRPTVHLQFDEATAILAGDALLTAAFGCLAEGIDDPSLAKQAIVDLSAAAGATRLVGGQSDDLAAEEGVSVSQEAQLSHLELIHRRKTGALIEVSLRLGGTIARANNVTQKILSDYADDLGLAFQVVDDLLDSTAADADLGKRTGKDADRGKLTYPGLLGVEGARQKATNLIESACQHASSLGEGAWRLDKLARYVLERTH